jgi:hypothetical protein
MYKHINIAYILPTNRKCLVVQKTPEREGGNLKKRSDKKTVPQEEARFYRHVTVRDEIPGHLTPANLSGVTEAWSVVTDNGYTETLNCP